MSESRSADSGRVFQVLTYEGRSLSSATAEELRAVIDDMARLYRKRLRALREEVEAISTNAEFLATVEFGKEERRQAIADGVSRICAELGLDSEQEGN